MDSQEDREGVEKGVQTKRSSQEDELEQIQWSNINIVLVKSLIECL